MTENQPSTSADGEKTPAASLGRPVHFEIQAADVERATAFYREVFSWSMQDWSEYAGMPYVGVSTGEGLGIDGAVLGRHRGAAEVRPARHGLAGLLPRHRAQRVRPAPAGPRGPLSTVAIGGEARGTVTGIPASEQGNRGEPLSYGKNDHPAERRARAREEPPMAIRRQVLRDEVEQLILQRLLENRWEPGSRLSIDGLARDLEVSPTPVREAMVALERSGLVEYVALRGYVVAPMLDAEHMIELLDARKVVESAALGRSFTQWEGLLADLETAHARHGEVLDAIEAAETVDYPLMNEHFRADWAFHQVFFEHAANRYLHTMVENLGTHTHRMRQTWTGAGLFDGRQAHSEHGEILEMVRRHHHDGALKALESHLDGVLSRSLSAVATEETRG